DIVGEDVTNKGRIDLSVFVEDKVYIIEFKVMENGQWKIEIESSEKLKVKSEKCGALKQIKEKKYYEKYKDKKVIMVGICFSKEEKNITYYEWEELC
ncbi:MAG: hypothetical protein GXO62_04205, partial [Epsilonproteobacteria bacterium]|nr:hypothetical protein [Campylobacterota bacterium]